MFGKTWAFLIIMTMSVPGACFKKDKEAAEIVKGMTLEQKIGQMLMVGVPGKSIAEGAEKIIEKYMPGSVIFFGYNLDGESEIKKFTEDLQKASLRFSGIPLFISIDQEGGRVRRIQDGVTLFPGNMAFGVVNDEDLVYDAARVLGIQLRRLGVNMNLAPVLDVNNNPHNPVINTRAFGSRSDVVSDMGKAYIEGIQSSMCIAVGKHFPGHGDTDKDSHITLPVIPYNMKRLEKIEFPPFEEAIDADVECIMTAHIAYPGIIKDDSPATISEKFLTEILRKEMDFEGVIITDDLEMDAISEMMTMGEAAVKSVLAGTDIVLISTHGGNIEKVFTSLKNAVKEGRVSAERIDKSVRRLVELKLRYKIMKYEENKISAGKIEYNERDLDFLKKAGDINKRASREALYFYRGGGPGLVLVNDDKYRKFMVTDNDSLIDEVNGIERCSVFKSNNSFLEFLKSFNDKKNGGSKSILFYHVIGIDAKQVNRIVKAAGEKGIKIILLCTGDPFPLGKLKVIPPALISFSSTDESVRQMAACLRGEFTPVTEINVDLGFNKSKE